MIMSYIMYDILKSSMFWKIWQRGGGANIIFWGGGSDGLDPALHASAYYDEYNKKFGFWWSQLNSQWIIPLHISANEL